MILPPCEKCGKDTFSSTSGRTLHLNQCKGPKAKPGPKLVKSTIVAPTTPFHCEGKGIGATLCGELADYRLIYEEDEVEAFAYACSRCKNDLKAKFSPKKVIHLPKPKGTMDSDGLFRNIRQPSKAVVQVKIAPEHKRALDELQEYAKDYWIRKDGISSFGHYIQKPTGVSKEDTQLLNDMIDEVSKYPGCEVSAIFCSLRGSTEEW